MPGSGACVPGRSLPSLMHRAFESDGLVIRNRQTILQIWLAGTVLLLTALWGILLAKISYDHRQLHQQAAASVQARVHVYAEQLRRTVKEIDQISLTVSYQWQIMKVKLDLADQYEKAMHHTPTFPVAIGADGRVLSSWRKASIGLPMDHYEFFKLARDLPDTGLRINPPGAGVGGMAGKLTIRFTRRINDERGRFAGVVMVSVEPAYLASLDADEAFNEGDFISVWLADRRSLLVARSVSDTQSASAYFKADPMLPGDAGSSHEPGTRFADGKARHVAWKKLNDYPLVAMAAITEDSAVAAYASTESTYLSIAIAMTLLILLGSGLGCAVQVSDAERRRHAEQVRLTFRLAVDGAREAFYMLKPLRAADGKVLDYRIEDCNERAVEMWGRPRDRIVGKSFNDSYAPDVQRKLKRFYGAALARGFIEDEVRIEASSGHAAGWYHRRAVRSGDGIALTVRDITESREHEESLRRLANTDTLTGLPNRHWLSEYLPAALERAHEAGKRVALLFIDLDNFKKINDTLGHAAGDQLLRAAATTLKAAVRSADHVARLGGDEFTVLIEGLEQDHDVELVAEQVVNSLASSASFSLWSASNVHCSVGVALYPSHAQDADSLLQCADAAMYEAKAAGKACYRVFASSAPASTRLAN